MSMSFVITIESFLRITTIYLHCYSASRCRPHDFLDASQNNLILCEYTSIRHIFFISVGQAFVICAYKWTHLWITFVANSQGFYMRLIGIHCWRDTQDLILSCCCAFMDYSVEFLARRVDSLHLTFLIFNAIPESLQSFRKRESKDGRLALN